MVLLLFLAFITLAPMVYLFYGSFIDPQDYALHGMEFPLRKISFANYERLLTGSSRVVRGFINSVGITVVGTVLSVLATGMLSYGLSKRRLPYRNQITFFIFFTMLFSGGLVPTYLTVRALGLLDSYLALILPQMVGAWYVFLFRNFLMTIPESLEEAAYMDGANEVTIFFRIMVPLSMPITATVSLFYAVFYWNKWFDALIYIYNFDKYPLQIILRNILYASQNMSEAIDAGEVRTAIGVPSEVLKMCAIVISTLPIASVYPFVQKYFIKGILVGSVKG
jgi:ABC-type glycerol-3-phosphate transport system permease component